MKTKFLPSFLTLIGLVLTTQTTHAQTYQPSNRIPVADKTLGTQVSGSGNNFTITGGVRTGQTLFQSFTDFSVPTNGQANFINPVGNRDIITRVTGNLFSDINGTVNSNGANFFLINPNGITFGTNAQLNVGKAFVGSTANSIDLVAGGSKITFGTNPNGDAPLLSISPNVLFDVSRLNLGGGNGAISNFGTLQTPNNSQYIGLLGGNVTLDGSTGGGKIIAPGGRIDIGGLKGAGSITLDNNGLVFGGTGLQHSDVLLTNGAGITVRATGTLDTVNTFFNNATSNGSSINISANNLDLLNAGANSSTLLTAIDAGLDTNSGVQTKPGGNINIDATGKVSLNNSTIKNTLRSGAEGSIGDIKIQAGTLDIINSGISTATAGTGNAGNLSFIVNGNLAVTNSNISTATIGKGNAGNIGITVNGGLAVNNNSIIFSDNLNDQGNAGDINIKTTGDIKISGADPSSTSSVISQITSDTSGQGDAGKITIDTQGKLSLVNNGVISSSINSNAVGNSKGINITARELELANGGYIATNTSQANRVDGKGNAGDINIKTTGDIKISGYNPSSTNSVLSQITSNTSGQGDTGKITIDTQGKLSLANNGVISSAINSNAVGNSKGINITARELELANSSTIFTNSLPNSQGNTGDINIKTTGDIKISGFDPSSTSSVLSGISSNTSGQGDAGKITIDTQGKLSLVNNGVISNSIAENAVGNSKGINITARELEIANRSLIYTSSSPNSQGNTGDINIKTTGNIKISGFDLSSINPTTSNKSAINSDTSGRGDTGKITIGTQGKLSLVNNGSISSSIAENAVGNSKGINITAREIELANNSFIATSTLQSAQGNAGDINIKTNGDIKISGYNSSSINPKTSDRSLINSSTSGRGDTGKITLDTQGKLLVDRGAIISAIAPTGVGNSKGINITAREIELSNNSSIATITSQTTKVEGTGKAGDINLNVQGSIQLNNVSLVTTSSLSTGQAGNISITGDRLLLLNQGAVTSFGSTATGGDISIFLGDKLLMRNNSAISSESGSNGGNGNGGNITISSPLIIAPPGNNDINANANGGNGGNVKIDSQGLFGIQYRLIGSPFTNDITASSTFGQNGTVNITTPGTDPGKDSTELPKVPTDASNQISQACSAGNRENKLTVAGRGGLPPNANDPLTSDVIWQDTRAASSQQTVSNATTNPVKLAPPAVGWVFDGKGKVTLIAAGSEGQPTGTSIACPQKVKQ